MDTTAQYQNPSVIYQYGKFNGLQSFPFNSAISTVKAQLNNTTLTLNTEQVKSALMKMMNYEDIAKWNGLSPSTPDSFYQNFVNGVYSNNNILGNFSYGSYDKAYQPRGVFPYASLIGVSANENQTDISATGRVSTVVVGGNNVSPYSYLLMRVKVTEGLMFLSPFIYSSLSNNQADFLGINNMVIEFTMNNGSRCLSNASVVASAGGGNPLIPTVTGVSLVSMNSADCLLQFKSMPPTLASKIDPKNCLNYYNIISYPYTTGRALASGASVSNISFSNVQLSQIPTKMLIYARPVQADLTSYDADFFFVISNLNITFANKAGLLSGASQQQLYNMSTKNLLQENYYEFTGTGISATTDTLTGIGSVPTIGSIIVIDPALDLSLDLEYSNNSTGQFNMTFQCTVQNQTATNYANFNLYLVCMNGGIFSTENGQSFVSTGMLTKQQVLETKAKNEIVDTHTYKNEIVGGSITNLNSVHKHLKMLHQDGSEKEQQMSDSNVEQGSALSAGAVSADSVSKSHKRSIHKFH